jgi:hypothetical protein
LVFFVASEDFSHDLISGTALPSQGIAALALHQA